MTEEILDRSQAIVRIARRESVGLSSEDADGLLLDLWGLDEEDEGVSALPRELLAQLLELESPPTFDRKIHSPLIELGLRAKYLGVRNEYLEKRLLSETGCSYSVVGPLEAMLRCHCCDYMCLRARGDYEVCPVCFWEDDGSELHDGHSAANRMSLREARRRFRILGCVDERHLSHLRPGRMERFLLAE